jgi:transposase-like protein
MATRRTFSSEFKHEAVRLIRERGVAVAHAAYFAPESTPRNPEEICEPLEAA